MNKETTRVTLNFAASLSWKEYKAWAEKLALKHSVKLATFNVSVNPVSVSESLCLTLVGVTTSIHEFQRAFVAHFEQFSSL